MHDDLFDGGGIDVAVDDAIATVGDHCRVSGILQDYNVFGANPLDQFAAIIDLILQKKQSFHVLVVNEMTTLIIVDFNGTWSKWCLDCSKCTLSGPAGTAIFSLVQWNAYEESWSGPVYVLAVYNYLLLSE